MFNEEKNSMIVPQKRVPGSPLLDYASKRKSGKNPLSIEDWILIMTRMKSVLEDIHKNGVMHRDVHPGNFLINVSSELPFEFDPKCSEGCLKAP